MTTTVTSLPSTMEMRQTERVQELLGMLAGPFPDQLTQALANESDEVVERFADCVVNAQTAFKEAQRVRRQRITNPQAMLDLANRILDEDQPSDDVFGSLEGVHYAGDRLHGSIGVSGLHLP